MSGYFRSISVGTKTALAFVTISLLMMVQAVLAMHNMSAMTSSFHVVSESGIPSVKNAGELTRTVAELQFREYQLAKASPAEMAAAQQQLRNSQDGVSSSIQQAKALADTDDERRLAQLAEQQWTSYLALDASGRGASGPPGSESLHRFDDLLATAERIVQVNADEAVEVARDADRSYRRSYDATLIVIVIAVVATLAFGWGLSRALSRRLADLLSMGRRIVDAGQSTLAHDALLETDELDQLTAVLGQVYESRNRGLSVSRLTHELRTPLNSILGFAELMLSERDAALPATHKGYVQQMIQSGQHLISLIDGLLELSKMEVGLANLRPVSVDLIDLVQEALQLIAPLAQARELRVRFDTHGQSARWVLADRTRLLQVVLNLLSNAVKYNRDGGLIEITVRPDAASGQVLLAVRDEGQGIAPQHRKELFKPFQRLGREVGAVQGTGLGLAISSKLMHLMHGDIQAESTLGVGSRFTVSMPAGLPGARQKSTPAQPVAAVPAPQPHEALPRQLAGTVLHVDDDEISRILMQAYFLSHPDVRLLSADAADAGIQIMRQERPDVVLVDICMPEADGFEFLRRMRAFPDLHDIRCVAVSANASTEDSEAALAAGFDGYLVKPLSMPTLFACVDPWLQPAA